MTIRQKQWQLYYIIYYGGEIDALAGDLYREKILKQPQRKSMIDEAEVS